MAYQIKDLEITNQLVYDLFSCICEDSFLSVLDRAALGPALALSPSRILRLVVENFKLLIFEGEIRQVVFIKRKTHETF